MGLPFCKWFNKNTRKKSLTSFPHVPVISFLSILQIILFFSRSHQDFRTGFTIIQFDSFSGQVIHVGSISHLILTKRKKQKRKGDWGCIREQKHIKIVEQEKWTL